MPFQPQPDPRFSQRRSRPSKSRGINTYRNRTSYVLWNEYLQKRGEGRPIPAPIPTKFVARVVKVVLPQLPCFPIVCCDTRCIPRSSDSVTGPRIFGSSDLPLQAVSSRDPGPRHTHHRPRFQRRLTPTPMPRPNKLCLTLRPELTTSVAIDRPSQRCITLKNQAAGFQGFRVCLTNPDVKKSCYKPWQQEFAEASDCRGSAFGLQALLGTRHRARLGHVCWHAILLAVETGIRPGFRTIPIRTGLGVRG